MNELQRISAFAWHQDIAYLIGIVLLAALLLYRFKPAVRRTLANTLGFFFACLGGLFISGIVDHLGFAGAASALHELFIVAEGMAVIRLSGLFVFRILLPLVRLTPPSILEDMLVILAYIIWGMVRLRYAGVDLSGIVTTSAVITAVIAFSMQDTLGNILGGLALELDNSFEIGDWIKADDVIGKVVDIRWRSTSIETRNWETVVIPNSVLMKTKFSVLGKRVGQPEQWRRWVWFNVDYSVPPVRVTNIVENAIQAADIPLVAKQPAPNCIMMDFDKSSARYAVRYWLTDLANDDPTDSAVRTHIYTALARAGIRLPVPEQNVHVIKEGEKQDQARHTRETNRRIAALRKIDLFRLFSESELHAVAESLKFAPFAKGDAITTQGAVAHWLYILTEGETDVVLETPNGKRTLNSIKAPSFFGEMGMMTGAPRSATVTAKTDVECYRLDKKSFESIIHSRPSMAEEITQVLVARQAELHSVQDDLAEAQRSQAQQHSEILSMVKRFFGL
ncbi:mechanosensitive ion channel protein MscS [Sulfurimicrobium lacus]|uniref:Small-conductance mechanosensitive channel n=1 Tax=Sulfurimicrobium lacus TaxID=2715678 RepID=A0A6F8VAY6_9PROT|nr:mechanosensitive ion channel family protein [Sulfurimicrobium lacus]BCB27003.1 mechanosensitive ion channel protein MscS [Sulfurimicrobium lacus]